MDCGVGVRRRPTMAAQACIAKARECVERPGLRYVRVRHPLLARPRRYGGVRFDRFLLGVDLPLMLALLAEIEQGSTDIVAKCRAMRLAHRTLDGVCVRLVSGSRLRHRDNPAFLFVREARKIGVRSVQQNRAQQACPACARGNAHEMQRARQALARNATRPRRIPQRPSRGATAATR